MATKTWRIGEYANYGIWQVVIEKDKVRLIGKSWDTKEVMEEIEIPYSKSLFTGEMESNGQSLRNVVYRMMEEQSTSYYGNEVADWVDEKVKS